MRVEERLGRDRQGELEPAPDVEGVVGAEEEHSLLQLRRGEDEDVGIDEVVDGEARHREPACAGAIVDELVDALGDAHVVEGGLVVPVAPHRVVLLAGVPLLRGEDEDRDLLEGEVLLDLAAQGEPVEAGHLGEGDDQRGTLEGASLVELAAARYRIELVPAPLESFPEGIGEAGVSEVEDPLGLHHPPSQGSEEGSPPRLFEARGKC